MENNNCTGETPTFKNLFLIQSKNGEDLSPEEIQKAISEQKYKVFVLQLDAKIEFMGAATEINCETGEVTINKFICK